MVTKTAGKSRAGGAAEDGGQRGLSRGRRPARERLLYAAIELFRAEGVCSVGIDRIIEHAGVAKASLYNSFSSKDDLVRAYLCSIDDDTTERLTAAINQHQDPRARLLAVFDAQAELLARPDYNGCAFANVTAERHSQLIRDTVAEFRGRIRDMFTDLADEAGASDPAMLGRQLHMIYDGVGLSGRMDRDPAIAIAARAAAEALLAATG
jgi:AcrR family transcriptional regulator